MNVKLINPRGRVITVDDNEVKELLKRGFVSIPNDQFNLNYSQIHDKGESYEEPYVEEVKTVKRVTPTIGDVLKVEII